MTTLSAQVKKNILPFIRSQVIPNDNRVQLKPGQSNAVIWKMAQRRKEQVLANVQAKPGAVSNIKLKSRIPYGLLIKNEQGQWRILAAEKGTNKSIEIIPEGQYSFVRTAQGFTRISAVAGDANHRALSDHADKVRYAGVIYFTKTTDGEAVINYWENASGGYQPEANRSALAGLPQADFRALSNDQHINSPLAKSKANLTSQTQPTAADAADVRLSTHRNTFFKFPVAAAPTPVPAVPVDLINSNNSVPTLVLGG